MSTLLDPELRTTDRGNNKPVFHYLVPVRFDGYPRFWCGIARRLGDMDTTLGHIGRGYVPCGECLEIMRDHGGVTAS